MKKIYDHSSEFWLSTTLIFAFILAGVLLPQIGTDNTNKRFSTVLKRSIATIRVDLIFSIEMPGNQNANFDKTDS